MNQLICVIALFASAVFAAPQSRFELEALLDAVDEGLNQIDTETKEEISLGSQFAFGQRFPDREGVVTGHRIPIELFPIETQSKLLVAPTPVDFVEVVVDDKYVDTTSFRGSKKATTATTSTTTTTTEAPTTTTTESTIRSHHIPIFSSLPERDNTHFRSLRIFAPPSFFWN